MSVTPPLKFRQVTKLVKKQLTPVRFNYPTGLLFLEESCGNLRASLKGRGTTSKRDSILRRAWFLKNQTVFDSESCATI
jgi:hypothetical protein